MHGLIFFELKKYVVDRFSPETWELIVKNSHNTEKNYDQVHAYPDKELAAILQAASTISGKPIPELLEDFGIYLAPFLLNSSKFLVDPTWSFIDLLEHTQEVIHTVVTRSIHGSAPPILRTSRTGLNQITIFYNSPRKMCDLAKGLIQGMAKHMQTTITIEEPQCMHRGDSHCKLLVSIK